MADTNALYGVAGAIGGALIAGGAAVVGPLLLHRRGARQTGAADTRARIEAEVSRMIRMRSSSRGWLILLEDTARELTEGRAVDAAHFAAAVSTARAELSGALDEGMHDGIWVVGGSASQNPYFASRAGDPGLPHPDPPRRSPLRPSRRRWRPSAPPAPRASTEPPELQVGHLVEVFARSSRTIGSHLTDRQPLPAETLTELRTACAQAAEARSRLSTHLVNRLEEIMGERPRRL
ncbi:hypothetical protein [Streptomyces sp. NPDC087300]|uniref:hypothetical protein n=1 Tax=Streptomyces sp. NPDC087300 TaxID=3365780 RepID=UPI00381A4CC9